MLWEPAVVAGVLATCVPANAKNLVALSVLLFDRGRINTYRKRKVPTNSPDMAMKWLRGVAGIRLKKLEAAGAFILLDSLDVDLLVSLRPKRPGRKPLFELS